ncbi:MAG: transglycosylase domain-containing protein [Deltaproteobacteria bacterium]|nr:transglycosylase domain-containing protein [Deltaproteobacteria bacterium]
MILHVVLHSDYVGYWLNNKAENAFTKHGVAFKASKPAQIQWPGKVVFHDIEVGCDDWQLNATQISIQPTLSALFHGFFTDEINIKVNQASLHTDNFSSDLNWHVDSGEFSVKQLHDDWRIFANLYFKHGSKALLAASIAKKIRVQIAIQDAQFEDLPPLLIKKLAKNLSGKWYGIVALQSARDLKNINLALRLYTKNLNISDLSNEMLEIGPVVLDINALATFNRSEQQLNFSSANIALGPQRELRASVYGYANLKKEGLLRLHANVHAPEMKHLLAVLPQTLQLPSDAPKANGIFNAKFDINGSFHKPLDWQIVAKLDLKGMRSTTIDLNLAKLKHSFTYQTTNAFGENYSFIVGPERDLFVPLAQLPSYVADAVTTSEDAGFFAHQGFDFNEIKNSVFAVVQAGKAVRGGSTITQQLAKNLYLSKEKTYVRKIREALIALALESNLTKHRLLEIYLNIIEWGPGIYGIGAAAQYYFNKDARDLTPREAVYLASVIPNPLRYYRQKIREDVSLAWSNRLDSILTRMSERGRLDAQSYVHALDDQLNFNN